MNTIAISTIDPKRSLTLVIGDMAAWAKQGRDMPNVDGYHFIDILDLTPAFMRNLAPDIVLSSLVGTNFDAVEIARKLGLMDYRGSYRVLSQNVPDVGLILAEVHSVAPQLNVDVIDVADIYPEI